MSTYKNMFNYTSTSKFHGSSYKTGTGLYNLVSQMHSKLTFSAHTELTKNSKLKKVNTLIKRLNKAIKVYENNKSIFTSSNTLSKDGKSLLKKPTENMYLNMKNARANLRNGKKYIKLSYYKKEVEDCQYFIDYAEDAIAESKKWNKTYKKYNSGGIKKTGEKMVYNTSSGSFKPQNTYSLTFPNYKKSISAQNKVMTSTQISTIQGWINAATKKKNDAQSRYNSLFNGGK